MVCLQVPPSPSKWAFNYHHSRTSPASAEVRAAIAEFLRFGGLVVEHSRAPSPEPSTATGTPSGPRITMVDGVAAAAALVSFPVRVPAELGEPDEVTITDDRVVSLGYRAAGARLDQFDGTLGLAFANTVPNQNDIQWVQVGGDSALWLRGPHELTYVDRAGRRHTEAARTAGDTLVWQRGGVTFQLEGPFGLDRAIVIAQSVR